MNHTTNTRRARLTAALGVAVAALPGACGDANDAASSAEARTTRTTTTTTTLTTTTTGVTFTRAADAVRHLYFAWRDGNRDVARAAASAEAVNDLFERPAAELSGSECNRDTGDTRCFMDGEGYSVIFEVVGSASRGYQVSAVSFATHPNSETRPPGQGPTATATPGQAAVGDTVRLQGSGFAGDPWEAEDAPFYLVGGTDDCALYAMARDTLVVEKGQLSGTFVVPATGDCRMAGREAAVTPGRYQLAYSCTACFIGEFTVVSAAA